MRPWRRILGAPALCRHEYEAAFEIEGHAGEQIGSKVTCGIEVAHAREAISALESPEHSFHRTTQWHDQVIARDLVGRERLGPLTASHYPVPEAPRLQVRPQ